jgi:hypothetical protein
VFSCYQQIIAFEIVRLRGFLERRYFPQGTEGVQSGSYVEFSQDPALQILNNAKDNCAAASGFSPGDRLKSLQMIIDMIGGVSDKLTVENPPEGPDPAGNPHLIAALHLIQEKIISRLGPVVNDGTRKVLIRSFGEIPKEGKISEETVCAVFVAIATRLQQLFEITGQPDAGFVFEPNLAAGMGALAAGDGKIIYLGLDALTGRKGPAELAADLIHEGSHAIALDPIGHTIDLVYINCNGHLYLPAGLALSNAANYEQVAREMLDRGLVMDDEAAAKMHRLEAPPPVLAHVLLSSRAARAWVRANDLGLKDPDLKLQNRETAGKGGLNPALPADPVLRDAWYAGLFEATYAVLSTVNKGLALTSADAPGAPASVDVVIENRLNAGKMTITFAKKLVARLSPEQLAMLTLLYILREKFGAPPELQPGMVDSMLSWGNSFLKSTVDAPPVQWVYNLISRIESMDRESLQKPLAAYYSSLPFKQSRPNDL